MYGSTSMGGKVACARACRPMSGKRGMLPSLGRRAPVAAAIRDPRGYEFEDWMTPDILEVQEDKALEMAARMRRVEVNVDGLDRPVGTALVGGGGVKSENPVVLLHGFDSNSLEFRRFFPLLSKEMETWAIDLVGWGFTDNLHGDGTRTPINPATKRAHLKALQEQVLGGRKIVLLGASLGGAVAIDFAFHHPELVEKVILVDAQGFIDGIGPMSSMPDWLAMGGIKILRTWALRDMANQMSYFDKKTFATEDAVRVGRVHTNCDGWADANLSWMKGGGYSTSQMVPALKPPVMVVWGKQDNVLDPKYAEMFRQALPSARVEYIDECGHVAHLEQPAKLLELVKDFVEAPAGAEVLA